MEGFTYNNIFDTKGIEYIIIIFFLMLIIPFWLLITRKSTAAAKAPARLRALTPSLLRIPPGVFHGRNHVWAYLSKSGTARLGVDDLLLHITGEVSIAHLAEPGSLVRRGEAFAEITSGGRRLRLFSPVSGEVQGINRELLSDPAILGEDPYGKGWITAIKPSAWLSDISGCYLASDAVEWSKKELARLRDFVAAGYQKLSPGVVPLMLQDGGELMDHPLETMPGEIWEDFEKEFMKV